MPPMPVGVHGEDPASRSSSLRQLPQLIPGPTHQRQGPHDRARLCSPLVSVQTLREDFPVFERIAYLNAGTDGPLSALAAQAGVEELLVEARCGRAGEHFERRHALAEQLRAAYARALGCQSSDVALTTCTSEGLS